MHSDADEKNIAIQRKGIFAREFGGKEPNFDRLRSVLHYARKWKVKEMDLAYVSDQQVSIQQCSDVCRHNNFGPEGAKRLQCLENVVTLINLNLQYVCDFQIRYELVAFRANQFGPEGAKNLYFLGNLPSLRILNLRYELIVKKS